METKDPGRAGPSDLGALGDLGDAKTAAPQSDPGAGMGRKVASGAFWVTVGSVAQQVINFGMFIYLAQALDPLTFGLMAIAMVFVESFTVFCKLGQADWLLHKTEVTDEDASTSFWLLMISGGFGTATLFALASPVALFFGEPEVAGVMMAMAPVCLITNLASVQEARLRRAFRFRAVAVRAALGSVISAVAALTAMALDWGVYALVAQKFALIAGIAAVTIALDPWRPRIAFGLSLARSSLVNGLRISSGMLTHQLTPRAVDMIVGATLGAVALGYLRIAWQLSYFVLNLFIYPVVNVASSAFGKIKEAPEAMAKTFASMVQGVLFFLAPAAIGLMTVAPLLIPAMLGEKWEPSVTVIQFTAVTFFTEVPCYLLLGVLVGVGRSSAVLVYGLIQTALAVVVVAVAAPYGIEAVAAAYLLRCVLCAAVAFYILNTIFPVRRATIAWAAAPTMMAAALMGAVVWTLHLAMLDSDLDRLSRLAILIATGGVSYAVFLGLGDLLRLWRGFLQQILGAVRQMRRG
ncbi:MAG: oligosaccharide flippase family protein [Pseudomonadota bacterium]